VFFHILLIPFIVTKLACTVWMLEHVKSTMYQSILPSVQ
jgi:hypothetical protein